MAKKVKNNPIDQADGTILKSTRDYLLTAMKEK